MLTNKIVSDNFFPEYPALVDVAQLAAILGIGRNKAYELLDSGEIRSVKVGKRHMIPKVCIVEFLNAKIEDNKV